MSTIEVNKITPVSGGTTVQVGESGDTINIPSGATIANAGTATGFAPVGISSSMTSGTGLSIDANGHVTKPLQPAFFANVSSNYDPGTSGNHNVQYATEVFDVNADYNTSNYTFTAPVTGKYLLTSTVRGYDVDSAWSLDHRIVTSNRNYYNNTGRFNSDQYVSTIVVVADMDASDTCDVLINANESSFQISGDTYSYFTGALLS